MRELTLGPRRYRDLATGLPGIPSNVLAGRLKDLQGRWRSSPGATSRTGRRDLYELTDAWRCSPHSTSCTGAGDGPGVSPDDAAQPGWALLNGAWPAGRAARRADLRAPGRTRELLPRLRRLARSPSAAGRTGRRRGGHHARRHPLQPDDRPDDRDRRRPTQHRRCARHRDRPPRPTTARRSSTHQACTGHLRRQAETSLAICNNK